MTLKKREFTPESGSVDTYELLSPEIDECLSDPCANGGNCSDQLGAFQCACQAGYGGDICQVGELQFDGDAATHLILFSCEWLGL